MEYGANIVRPSKLWAEIRPQIGNMINACSNLESSFEKTRSEAYNEGFNDGINNKEPDIEAIREEAYHDGYKTGRMDEKDDSAEERDNAYQRGLNDAWEAARKTIDYWMHCQTVKIFGISDVDKIFDNKTASEAIEKLKAYEEKKKAEEIKVGDEVMLQEDHEENGICISKEGDKMYVMWSDGSAGKWEERDLIKTGRHFPEIAEIFQKLESTN